MKSFLSRAVIMWLEVFGEESWRPDGCSRAMAFEDRGDGDSGWLRIHVVTWACCCLGLYPWFDALCLHGLGVCLLSAKPE